MMRRWMLVPAQVVPDAPLSIRSRIEWRDSAGLPYLVGTVTECIASSRLTVELHDRSWPRPARPAEVTWAFALSAVDSGTRLHYRLGDLSIDPQSEGWLRAYGEADEPARLARLLEEPAP